MDRREFLAGTAATALAASLPRRARATIQETEHAKVAALVGDQYPAVRAVESGVWNSPATWGGRLPHDGEDFYIPRGITVGLGHQEQARLHFGRVEGELHFEPNVLSRLLIDTLIIPTHEGHLKMGTAAAPITGLAELVFIDTGPRDVARDPGQLSRGLVSEGHITAHGHPKTAWGYLGVAPAAGTTSLTFVEPPQGWAVGDRIVIPGLYYSPVQDEIRVIEAITGNVVSIVPLTFGHQTPVGEPGIRLPVGNLSRNVVFRSENPSLIDRRGHVMLMLHGESSIGDAAFIGLGRTRKDIAVDAVNARGRYPLHFHRNDKAKQIVCKGVAIEDSPGWGLVNHSSNVLAEDCVSYRVFGSHFTGEAGDEAGAFRRCFAVRSLGPGGSIFARDEIGDFGISGHGFWLQGPSVALEDNVACGNRSSAIAVVAEGIVETDTGVVADPQTGSKPFAGIKRNTVFASFRAFELWQAKHESNKIEDSLTWGMSEYHGALVRNSRCDFIGGNYLGYNFRGGCIEYVSAYDGVGNVQVNRMEGWKLGSNTPGSGKSLYQGGSWKNETDIHIGFVDKSLALTIKDIPGVTINAISRRFPEIKELAQVDFKVLIENGGTRQQLYLPYQLPGYVFTEAPLAGLTNQQIYEQYGRLTLGGLVPPGSTFNQAGQCYLGPVSPGYAANVEMLSPWQNKVKSGPLTYSWNGVEHTEQVAFNVGWNLFTRERDGVKYTFFLRRIR